MASRQSFPPSNRSIHRGPSTKAKPSHLRGVNVDNSDQDYLKDDLLEGGQDDVLSPTFLTTDSPKPPPQRGPHDLGSNRLIIAIDYGTTFTGVAFATPRSDNASLEDIEIVDNWGPKMGVHSKIPSVYSYSPASPAGEQQWGASLSPKAVTMVNTKLELDVQDNKLDELELILQVLEGTCNLEFENVKKSRGYPEYAWKNPEDIVIDYLTKVFQYLNQAVEYFGSHLRAQIPVDIVITVPVKWSYRAKNSTLRAVMKAGFNEETYPNLNDIIIVSEPEAAAIYTARYLKQDKKKEFLKASVPLGECFILCDAGGGTVDVVSYKVTQLEPTLEFEEMTIATSEKCGSAYIDTNFKRWLNRIIGDRHYRALDPKSGGQQISANTMEGEHMRLVMKEFDARKKIFSNNVAEMKLDLPKPLDKVNIPGKVKEGELTITHKEMKDLFDPCVNKVIELLQGQIAQVEIKRNRVKNVFLVGGFGESPFLQEELKQSLDLRKVTMRRPDTANSWTAVVQGAVIYGIEKAHHKNVTVVSTCSRSYGIALNEVYSVYKYDRKDLYTDHVTNNVMAKKQLTWLIRRGDLLLSDAKKETDKEFMFPFLDMDNRKFKLPIYEYPDDDDDVPDRFETGQNELVEVAVLNCDLSTFPISEFDRLENPQSGRLYYAAYLICKILLSGTSLEIEIHWNGKKLCHTKIKDVENSNAYIDSWRRHREPVKTISLAAEPPGEPTEFQDDA